ncbi:MAG TPA: NAD(P)H-quinone oxidoreductase [Asticcacaulis sp.]
MKAISVHNNGEKPDDLYPVDAPAPEVPDGHVLIRTRFAGVNRPDVLQRRGLYPPPPGASPILGLEVAGVIAQGAPGWPEGTEVCALVNGGGYAEYVSVDARHLLPVPKGLTLAEAASLPENVLTVYANLIEHGGLRPGETVLVHGGNSGIGAMTIQIAKAIFNDKGGAYVIATARGAAKCAYARRSGADLVIDSAAGDFVAPVKAAGGADVALDIVGGDFVAKNLLCLNMRGRIVQVGFGKSAVVEIDLRRVIAKQAVLTGSMLRPRSADEKARLTRAVRERVWPLIESGMIRPILSQTVPFAQAAEAHRWLEAGDHCGKAVLELPTGP